ncbi:acetyl-CoA carboxylase biotin carboxylase subunit family protein [Helicobacter sp. MIT 14-3879]|uniref:ATP-grasp domain-containing protein n=1 Tax=Helicobacter sp. MIT 14-3879 TaxID=2040649 RepID=UPI000E1EA7A5|nr:ATP-grasp domain-containing protein [Helicobacter sp. MIT 14-3879]RDU64787.1 carbamoyl-phosphate-synthetase [Helicobacter sp. MIT 14-3879]
MRLLMLGGSYFQMPAIQKAKDMGHYVITCDYLPNNPGHSLSDEYYNISTTSKDDVLNLSKKLQIDGILAYASDPAAPTAAYVAENLGLETSPYKSVEILTNKKLFRKFLRNNNFNAPKSMGFNNLQDAIDCFDKFTPPLILKPVDSSGSKGVFKIENKGDLIKYFTKSMSYSNIKEVVLEEWIEYDFYQIAGDGFSIDGELIFSGFANEHFDKYNFNPFAPIGESFPYSGDSESYTITRKEIERLISLLNMKTGAYNFDIRLKNKQVYFLEVAPRNGGNLIPQVIEKTFGIDLVRASICASLGLSLDWFRESISNVKVLGYFACYVLHSKINGVFRGLSLGDEFSKDVVFKQLFIREGDLVSSFNGSNATLGIIIFKSNSEDEMLYRMENMNRFVKILLDSMGGGCKFKIGIIFFRASKPSHINALCRAIFYQNKFYYKDFRSVA